MNLWRGTVATSLDPTLDCTIWANIPGHQRPVAVTYLSPISNFNTGFFAPPPQGSEIYVLEQEVYRAPTEAEAHITADPIAESEYIYLGSVVGKKVSFGKSIDEQKLDKGWKDAKGPTFDLDAIAGIDDTSLGADSAQGPHGLALDARRAYDGKGIVPEQQVWSSPGGHFLKFSDQSKFGTGEGFINHFAEFASGYGKSIKLWDCPGQNLIEISPGDGLLGRVIFAGAQDSVSSQGHTFAEGEFRVDTGGPIRLNSSASRIVQEVWEGFNIEISNYSTGFLNPNFEDAIYEGADPILFRGGGDVYWFDEFADPLPTDGEPLWPVLPKASAFQAGQIHADMFPAIGGGNPVRKGNEEYGCINIKSDWNNINLEGFGPDSVIHINAPYLKSKIVLTTGGTVDIVAKGKVSITSGSKIELNAPHVDINTWLEGPVDLTDGTLATEAPVVVPGRVDID